MGRRAQTNGSCIDPCTTFMIIITTVLSIALSVRRCYPRIIHTYVRVILQRESTLLFTGGYNECFYDGLLTSYL